MATIKEILVPDIGDNAGVDVIEILVSVGDQVETDDGLITLETDKATMDIPAPFAGKVAEIKIAEGDKVSKGSLIMTFEVSGAEDAPAAEAAPADVDSAPVEATVDAADSVQPITVPDIGDNAAVDVIEILVSVGDEIDVDDGLITLETDKATMDIPAPVKGVVQEIVIEVGAKVSKGDLIGYVTVAGAAKSAAPAVKAPAIPASMQEQTQQRVADASKPSKPEPTAPSGKAHATPSVRRYARELGADISKVPASGRKGRVLKDDVQAYVKDKMTRMESAGGATGGAGLGFDLPEWPDVDFAKFGEIEVVELGRIQKISGPALHRNWVSIPHVTQFDEADITELEAFRKNQKAVAEKEGVKLTPLAFMMKAAAKSLVEFPAFNSSLSKDGKSIILKKYVNIGVAVDTPNGLVVPVVKDVDKKGIYDIARDLMEISERARKGKLTAADMQGSTFTISSLGGIGGTAFTPIVNAPDVAILGISKSSMKPVWDGKAFEPRLMLPLSLSYDHRVIDGALGCRFVTHLSGLLGDMRRILL